MKKKEKKYIMDKAIIIIVSMLTLFNGFGLIIAGKKVNKKSWIKWGITYMAIEWVCVISGIGSTLAVILCFVSIIHTALICSEYGRMLNAKNNGASEQEGYNYSPISTNSKKDPVERAVTAKPGIAIDGLPLKIGTASVFGTTKESVKIRIQNHNGKTFEFVTNGNTIELLETSGKKYNYGG